MHPVAGPLLVHASVGDSGVVLAAAAREALYHLDQMTPARPAGGKS
jgi:hypothetical protein